MCGFFGEKFLQVCFCKKQFHFCLQKKEKVVSLQVEENLCCSVNMDKDPKEFSPAEEQMIQESFDALLDAYAHTLHRQRVEIIRQTFEFAKRAHAGVRRLMGEPYIMHPLAVAHIVVKDIGLGSTSISAALLHDVVEDTDYTVEDIRNLFGDRIALIVDGLTKISGGIFGPHASEQAENFRKLLLTMSDDIRVVLIKIADRLHNMRTLEAQPQEKRYKIAGETMYIYAPLAHRLGLYTIKEELEDLSFRYENPNAYFDIEQKLLANKKAQMESFEKFVAPIRTKLDTLGLEYRIEARIKSIYSIWKKMTAKHITFDEVYDLLAVRIVFTPETSMSEHDQCWRIYSALTEIYRPHPERIRDWLSIPKSNGYEALHVTLLGQGGQWVEVQIRSQRMHDLAERGLAAHWRYKVGSEVDDSELDKWLKSVREVLVHPDTDAMNFLETFKLSLFAREVFVFTPSGEVKTIAQNSTVLDFAYYLHTDMGNHCIGAKVNHEIQSLNYVLHDGDLIEIMTDEQQKPQVEWLSFVVTAKAKNSLTTYFRSIDRQTISHGKHLLEVALSTLNLSEKYDMVVHRLMTHYQFEQMNQLFLQIGSGMIPLNNIPEIINMKRSFWQRLNPFNSDNDDEKTLPQPTETQNKNDKGKSKNIVLTDENLGHECILADCCHPILGDDVLAFYDDQTDTYTVHQVQCQEILKLKSSRGKSICSATWSPYSTHTFLASISIEGIDQAGLLIKILHIVSENYHINMHKLDAVSKNGIFCVNIQVYVHSKTELKQLLKSVQSLKEVKSVHRVNDCIIES